MKVDTYDTYDFRINVRNSYIWLLKFQECSIPATQY